MALSFTKLTILVGAGLAGAVIAKEGLIPIVSDLVSGVFKISTAVSKVKRDDSTKVTAKPINDKLMDQVNILREELQMMASTQPVTIINVGKNDAGKYGIVAIVIVVGSGYLWWKGWRLPDMMIATRGTLSDACATVAQQLDNVYSSIRGTRRHLSSKIDTVDSRMDEIAELTSNTHQNVSEIRESSENITVDVRSVSDAVKTLGKRIHQIEGRQELTLRGVKYLCDYAQDLETNMIEQNSEATCLPSPSPSGRVDSLLSSESINCREVAVQSIQISDEKSENETSASSWWRHAFFATSSFRQR